MTRTLTDESLAAHGPLREDLTRWLAKARTSGLDDESIEALFANTFRNSAPSNGSTDGDGADPPPATTRRSAPPRGRST